MKVTAAILLVAAATAAAGGAVKNEGSGNDRTITKVVKLLQSMLEESKKEGDTERELYAKYKCYCDDKETDKKTEIADLTEDIALLESKIEKLLASTAVLSKELAQIKADIAEVDQALASALSLRNKENSAYLATESDLTTAIGALNSSIIELATIGADQTLESGADHKQFMAGESLVSLRSHVKQALFAASMMVTRKQEQKLQAFLQAPFTGSYTSQSGEVFGILKDMRDTFMANLAEATDTEKKALDAYLKFKKAKEDERGDLVETRTKKEGVLSSNDGDLPTKRQSLNTAVDDKGKAETFLSNLIDMCTTKSKEYEHRVMLRTNEQAAIAQAISILNSDAAFATFGTVEATKTGATSLLQFREVHLHKHEQNATGADLANQRQQVQKFLRGAAGTTHSMLLSKLAAMLEVDNPFDTVLEEIKKMLAIIDEEEKADDEQLSWCNDERTTNNKNLGDKKGQISGLQGDISVLETAIDDPVTGLRALIEETETNIKVNADSQASETKTRTEANRAYQKNIRNLQEADGLLTKAIKVLKAYYSELLVKEGDKYAMIQGRRVHQTPAGPDPGPTWAGGGFKGQEGSGNNAVGMLEYILGETQKEEADAHKVEADDQHAYEDSMKTLTDEEADLLSDLAGYQQDLAKKEEQLLGKRKDLKDTTAEKEKIEAYLQKIRPGCDFITTNIDLRKSNRAEETTALNTATNLLKNSAAYETAVAQSHNESLGACLEFCAGDDEETAKCKACLAEVTVPAYCAGHPGTAGC